MALLPRRYVKCTVIRYDDLNREIGRAEFEYQNSKGYRIDFSVIKFPGGNLNTAEIQIYNLSEDSSKFITESSTRDIVILEAGYNDKRSVIYKGFMRTLTREKNGPDIINRIQSNNQNSTAKTVVAKTIKEQPLNNLLDQLASENELKIERDNFEPTRVQGKAYFSGLENVLTELANTYDFDWHVNDNVLRVTKNEGSALGAEFKFDPSTGLLRIPVRTEKGTDVLTLLEPLINPTDVFELESRFNKFNLGQQQFVQAAQGTVITQRFTKNLDTGRFVGTYRCMQVVHEGSTHENVWQTGIEGLQI